MLNSACKTRVNRVSTVTCERAQSEEASVRRRDLQHDVPHEQQANLVHVHAPDTLTSTNTHFPRDR